MAQQSEYKAIIKTPKDIAITALQTVREEAAGKQLGLKTRFSKVNIAIGKYFRFKQVYAIAGLSGHLKSFFLNTLIQDFLNPQLNLGICVHEYIICHHSFEMNPEDEELRKASSKLGVSYNHLLSSEFQSTGYNTLSEEEIEALSNVLHEDVNKPLYYFDEPCELKNLAKNVIAAIKRYKEDVFADKERLLHLCGRKGLEFTDIKEPEQVPSPKVVITIDHTLLLKQSETEKDILQTMRNLSKTAIALKKKGYLVIFLGQLNNNIEKIERIKNVEVQYPIKSDIYAQGEIYNACDGVFTIHRPELLGILKYGKNLYNTNGLVHLQVLKMRFGKVGSIWFKNELHRGLISEYDTEDLKRNSA